MRRSFFLALARFGRFAFGALDRVALLADLGIFLGDLALFGLAQAGIAKRMRPAAALFVGQRVKDDAGRLGRGAAWAGTVAGAAAAGAAAAPSGGRPLGGAAAGAAAASALGLPGRAGF